MKKVNAPNCGTLRDLSDFTSGKGQEHDGYTVVSEMMPYARKFHNFNANCNRVATTTAGW
jgi:hypothetical protein